jgi:uncharacterized membrane protein YtjA (UPF0391 family)
MLKRTSLLGAIALIVAATTTAQAGSGDRTLIVTASNLPVNQLLVYSPGGALLEQIPTGGQGGVGGNSGGIAQNRDRLAVVNFLSGNVSVFTKDLDHANLRLESVFATNGSPVSVAFGRDHLYVLTTTNVESHALGYGGVSAGADGLARLALGDGSAAQVGVLPGELIVTEKTGVIERVGLSERNAITGTVRTIATGLSAPFGLATRAGDAYVSIAHSNEVSLVRHDAIVAEAGTGQQLAPCWVALDGPFLFSTNSPSQSISRFVVHGKMITLDAEVAATFNGKPTDIDYGAGIAAVVDSDGTNSHLSVLAVDEDGNLTLKNAATLHSAATNGVVIVGDER